MCFLNKLLVFFVFVGIAANFYFSAITLKTHSVWRTLVNERKAKLEEVNASIHAFHFGGGTPPTDVNVDYWTDVQATKDFQPSMGYLKKALARIQAFRGNHSWFDCPATTDGSGNATVKIEGITEGTLPVGTRVYAFEDNEDASAQKYVGMFFVKTCGDGEVTLAPDQIAIQYPRMKKNITASVGNWSLYEIMPTDSHEAFMGKKITEELLRATLPDSTEDQFVKDGQKDPATGETYIRQLRAYEIWFELFFTQDILLNDLILIEASDLISAEEDLKLAQERVAIQEKVKGALTNDKNRYDKEYSVIKEHATAMDKQLKDLNAKKASYEKDIRDKAEKIAKRDYEIYKNAPSVVPERVKP